MGRILKPHHALTYILFVLDEGELWSCEYFLPAGSRCPAGTTVLDAISWFGRLLLPTDWLAAWLPHVASISCLISIGNWYLFCATLVYYRWNIDKFLLTGEDCWWLFPYNWASLSVFFYRNLTTYSAHCTILLSWMRSCCLLKGLGKYSIWNIKDALVFMRQSERAMYSKVGG